MIAIDICDKEDVYRDQGTEPAEPDMRFNGYVLGVSSKVRLARILDDLGHPDWLLRAADDSCTFSALAEEVRVASGELYLRAMRTASRDGRPHVRVDVARFISSEMQGTIDALARDASLVVRAAIASRKELSLPLIRVLAMDPDEIVRYAVAYRRDAPRAVLEMLAEDGSMAVAQRAKEMLRHQ